MAGVQGRQSTTSNGLKSSKSPRGRAGVEDDNTSGTVSVNTLAAFLIDSGSQAYPDEGDDDVAMPTAAPAPKDVASQQHNGSNSAINALNQFILQAGNIYKGKKLSEEEEQKLREAAKHVGLSMEVVDALLEQTADPNAVVNYCMASDDAFARRIKADPHFLRILERGRTQDGGLSFDLANSVWRVFMHKIVQQFVKENEMDVGDVMDKSSFTGKLYEQALSDDPPKNEYEQKFNGFVRSPEEMERIRSDYTERRKHIQISQSEAKKARQAAESMVTFEAHRPFHELIHGEGEWYAAKDETTRSVPPGERDDELSLRPATYGLDESSMTMSRGTKPSVGGGSANLKGHVKSAKGRRKSKKSGLDPVLQIAEGGNESDTGNVIKPADNVANADQKGSVSAVRRGLAMFGTRTSQGSGERQDKAPEGKGAVSNNIAAARAKFQSTTSKNTSTPFTLSRSGQTIKPTVKNSKGEVATPDWSSYMENGAVNETPMQPSNQNLPQPLQSDSEGRVSSLTSSGHSKSKRRPRKRNSTHKAVTKNKNKLNNLDEDERDTQDAPNVPQDVQIQLGTDRSMTGQKNTATGAGNIRRKVDGTETINGTILVGEGGNCSDAKSNNENKQPTSKISDAVSRFESGTPHKPGVVKTAWAKPRSKIKASHGTSTSSSFFTPQQQREHWQGKSAASTTQAHKLKDSKSSASFQSDNRQGHMSDVESSQNEATTIPKDRMLEARRLFDTSGSNTDSVSTPKPIQKRTRLRSSRVHKFESLPAGSIKDSAAQGPVATRNGQEEKNHGQGSVRSARQIFEKSGQGVGNGLDSSKQSRTTTERKPLRDDSNNSRGPSPFRYFADNDKSAQSTTDESSGAARHISHIPPKPDIVHLPQSGDEVEAAFSSLTSSSASSDGDAPHTKKSPRESYRQSHPGTSRSTDRPAPRASKTTAKVVPILAPSQEQSADSSTERETSSNSQNRWESFKRRETNPFKKFLGPDGLSSMDTNDDTSNDWDQPHEDFYGGAENDGVHMGSQDPDGNLHNSSLEGNYLDPPSDLKIEPAGRRISTVNGFQTYGTSRSPFVARSTTSHNPVVGRNNARYSLEDPSPSKRASGGPRERSHGSTLADPQPVPIAHNKVDASVSGNESSGFGPKATATPRNQPLGRRMSKESHFAGTSTAPTVVTNTTWYSEDVGYSPFRRARKDPVSTEKNVLQEIFVSSNDPHAKEVLRFSADTSTFPTDEQGSKENAVFSDKPRHSKGWVKFNSEFAKFPQEESSGRTTVPSGREDSDSEAAQKPQGGVTRSYKTDSSSSTKSVSASRAYFEKLDGDTSTARFPKDPAQPEKPFPPLSSKRTNDLPQRRSSQNRGKMASDVRAARESPRVQNTFASPNDGRADMLRDRTNLPRSSYSQEDDPRGGANQSASDGWTTFSDNCFSTSTDSRRKRPKMPSKTKGSRAANTSMKQQTPPSSAPAGSNPFQGKVSSTSRNTDQLQLFQTSAWGTARLDADAARGQEFPPPDDSSLHRGSHVSARKSQGDTRNLRPPQPQDSGDVWPQKEDFHSEVFQMDAQPVEEPYPSLEVNEGGTKLPFDPHDFTHENEHIQLDAGVAASAGAGAGAWTKRRQQKTLDKQAANVYANHVDDPTGLDALGFESWLPRSIDITESTSHSELTPTSHNAVRPKVTKAVKSSSSSEAGDRYDVSSKENHQPAHQMPAVAKSHPIDESAFLGERTGGQQSATRTEKRPRPTQDMPTPFEVAPPHAGEFPTDFETNQGLYNGDWTSESEQGSSGSHIKRQRTDEYSHSKSTSTNEGSDHDGLNSFPSHDAPGRSMSSESDFDALNNYDDASAKRLHEHFKREQAAPEGRRRSSIVGQDIFQAPNNYDGQTDLQKHPASVIGISHSTGQSSGPESAPLDDGFAATFYPTGANVVIGTVVKPELESTIMNAGKTPVVVSAEAVSTSGYHVPPDKVDLSTLRDVPYSSNEWSQSDSFHPAQGPPSATARQDECVSYADTAHGHKKRRTESMLSSCVTVEKPTSSCIVNGQPLVETSFTPMNGRSPTHIPVPTNADHAPVHGDQRRSLIGARGKPIGGIQGSAESDFEALNAFLDDYQYDGKPTAERKSINPGTPKGIQGGGFSQENQWDDAAVPSTHGTDPQLHHTNDEEEVADLKINSSESTLSNFLNTKTEDDEEDYFVGDRGGTTPATDAGQLGFGRQQHPFHQSETLQEEGTAHAILENMPPKDSQADMERNSTIYIASEHGKSEVNYFDIREAAAKNGIPAQLVDVILDQAKKVQGETPTGNRSILAGKQKGGPFDSDTGRPASARHLQKDVGPQPSSNDADPPFKSFDTGDAAAKCDYAASAIKEIAASPCSTPRSVRRDPSPVAKEPAATPMQCHSPFSTNFAAAPPPSEVPEGASQEELRLLNRFIEVAASNFDGKKLSADSEARVRTAALKVGLSEKFVDQLLDQAKSNNTQAQHLQQLLDQARMQGQNYATEQQQLQQQRHHHSQMAPLATVGDDMDGSFQTPHTPDDTVTRGGGSASYFTVDLTGATSTRRKKRKKDTTFAGCNVFESLTANFKYWTNCGDDASSISSNQSMTWEDDTRGGSRSGGGGLSQHTPKGKKIRALV